MSDNVRPRLDSTACSAMSETRKCPIWCPIMSGAVRCCPILSVMLSIWSIGLQGPRGVCGRSQNLAAGPQDKVQMAKTYMSIWTRLRTSNHLLRPQSSADYDLTSKFKSTLLMKMVGDLFLPETFMVTRNDDKCTSTSSWHKAGT